MELNLLKKYIRQKYTFIEGSCRRKTALFVPHSPFLCQRDYSLQRHLKGLILSLLAIELPPIGLNQIFKTDFHPIQCENNPILILSCDVHLILH